MSISWAAEKARGRGIWVGRKKGGIQIKMQRPNIKVNPI